MQPKRKISDQELTDLLSQVSVPGELKASLSRIPTLHGPTLHGPTLHGPNLHGPSLHGPNLHGPSLDGPTLHEQVGTGLGGHSPQDSGQQSQANERTSVPSSILQRMAQGILLERRLLISAALAAGVLLSVGVIWRGSFASNDRQVLDNQKIEIDNQSRPVDVATEPPANVDALREANLELAIIQANIDALRVTIQQAKNDRLHQELQDIQSQSASSLSTSDVLSMVIALSDQTAIALGGSEEHVAQQMQRVIKLYPESKGAQIAEEFLSQHRPASLQ